MNDIDIDQLLDEQEPQTTALQEVAGLADRLREALVRMEGIDLVRATPERRQEVADFRDMLLDWMEPMKMWINRIDAQWRDASARTGITQFPLTDGRFVTLEEPPSTYQTQEQQLRTALLAFVRDGLLTQEDVDKAVTPMTIYKVHHGNLNTLHRKRGSAVAETIDRFRQKMESTPSAAKVVYPRMAGRKR